MHTCIRRKSRLYLSRNSNKIRTSCFQNFFRLWTKCREPVNEVIYGKKECGLHAFKRVTHVYGYKILTITVFVYISYSARRALDA